MTQLVVIKMTDETVMEMSQYISNKFGSTVSLDLKDVTDTNDLKNIIEDYRLNGLQVLA